MFKEKRDQFFLVFILLFFALIQFYLLITEDLRGWDESVYVSMGKWLISHGEVGLFEVFRPILLPFFSGIFSLMNLDPFFAGGLLVMFSATLLLVLVYKSGEKIYKGSGLFASILLGFTPLFLHHAHLPMTDILSASISFFAIYLLTENKYFFAGVLSALSFLARFPQGLVLLVLAFLLVIKHFEGNQFQFKSFLKNSSYSLLGFAVLTIPYFILFLVWELFKKRKISIPALSMILGFLVFYLYFSLIDHKILRFALASLPYMAVLGGVAIASLLSFLKTKDSIVFPLLIIMPIFLVFSFFSYKEPGNSMLRSQYYSYLENLPYGAQIIATEPIGVPRSSVKLV